MKALTLTQPWASLVAAGLKLVETRTWHTSYRGQLAIHAARDWPPWARGFAETELGPGRLLSPIPRGAVLCVVELADMRRTEEIAAAVSALERHYGNFAPGRWAWVFKPGSLFVFDPPVPASGRQGLWEMDPARLFGAYGEHRGPGRS